MFLKKIIILPVFTLILLFGLFALDFSRVEAACQQSNVSGWAWSDSIGWVSLSCTNHAGTINYGVNIDQQNGMMSGFAWSDTIGWISFNSADLHVEGCPDWNINRNNCRAALLGNNNLSGWVRALTTGEWISLAGSIGGGGTYGVRLIHPQFHGWAWGDNNIGWLSWNCANPEITNDCADSPYAVTTSITTAPTVTNTTSTVRYCDYFITPQVATGTTVTLDWAYSHPNRPQDRYEIHISQFSDFPAGNRFEVERILSSASYSLNLTDSRTTWKNVLSWNTSYHWRVRVRAEGSLWSDWTTSTFTIARLHPSPLAVFSYTPQRITTNEVVTFIAERTGTVSRTFDGSVPRYDWTFDGGNPASRTSTSTVTTTFGVVATRQATLRVTESPPSATGYWCEFTEPLTIAVPLPDWREITPFGRIRLFLSDVAQRFQSLFAIYY